jgi:hypothetical protein
MPDHSNDTKLALWKNNNRQKPTQPILKGGKPQTINGQEFWVSAWINAPKDDPALAEAIERMVDTMTNKNGNYPLVTVSLSPVEGQGYAPSTAPAQGGFDAPQDEIPF